MGTPGGIDAADETLEIAGTAAKTRELLAGMSLGKYRLEHVLGVGGMGVVWAAHDPDLDRAVALKILRYDNPTAMLRHRLLREAQAMARLKHPNVLTVYEVDSEGDRDFIAMELVEGTNLDRWLATRPSRDEVWHAIIAAGRGLAAAHRAGLVHRDFKPHNVLRSHDGRVLVTDFGLARGHGGASALAIDAATPVRASGIEPTLDAVPSHDGGTTLDAASARTGATTPDTVSAHTSATTLDAVSPTGTTDLDVAPASNGKRAFDAPLTRSGALLGTPPYMAPEQFLGTACDPRTDQFAYCVTAWQLFSGERPFRGATIDELRRAASSGPANARGKLPAAIRAVLARGLEPDPVKRWPDMNALIAALERVRTRPRRRWLMGLATAVLGLAAVLALQLSRAPSKAVDSSVCEASPEAEMAGAWSPALRASLTRHFAGNPDFGYPADELDGFAARWISDYRSACASPRRTRTFAKLGCLLGERDEVTGLVELLPTIPAAALPDLDMGGVLPRVQACDGESPVVPPILPGDPVKRAKIRQLRTEIRSAQFAPVDKALAEMPGVLARAEALRWDPILAEAHEGFGLAARRAATQWELARDHYKRASQLALRSHHYHLEANLWIERLFSELDAASEPGNPDDFAHLVEQARDAAHSAGDDPVHLARIKWMESNFQRSTGRLDDALASLSDARAIALSARDFVTAILIASNTAVVLASRNCPGDLDAAWKMLVDTEHAATAAKLSEVKLRRLTSSFRLIALLRGDLAAAHEWDDREGPPKPGDGAAEVRGRVVDMHGAPVSGATVVAWSGILEGDATRAYRRVPQTLAAVYYQGDAPRAYQEAGFEADVATTDAGGGFTVRAARGAGIIAELGDRRSRPRAIADGALVLRLEPTRAIEGRVASDDEVLSGIAITARYQLGPRLAWDCTAAVGRLHDYRLAGLPDGRATLRLDDWLVRPRKLEFGPVRDGAEPRWPVGPDLDVIVRGRPEVTPWVYVLRGHPVAKTTADLDRLVDGATEATVNPALVVGAADGTAEGAKYYQRNDRHRCLFGYPPGEVTVCVAEADPASPAACQTIEIPRITPTIYEGGGIYPALPVVFQR